LNSILALQAHPYALLMREFYFQLPRRQRPHVFGMTASPVNVRATHTLEKVGATIVELETTLDAKVRCHDDCHFHDLFPTSMASPVDVLATLGRDGCGAWKTYRRQGEQS